jgi:hypothetical protein
LSYRRAVIALAALLVSIPSAGRAATVWTTVASEKVRPEAQARQDRAGVLAAAKNEFEAFQVVVTGPATGVSASASELTGAGSLAAPRLYREALIEVKQLSSADSSGAGRYPDALVPDVDEVVGEKRNAFPFDVPAGESRAIWVEVHVPANAVAGDYQGSVTVSWQGGEAQVPLHLTVWDFALPSTSSLKTAFGMHYAGIPAAHGKSGDQLPALRQRYGTLGLDHRISLHNVWDDSKQTDWNHFDQTWGPLLDGTAATQLKGAKLTSISAGVNLNSVADHQNWASHFQSKGWFDRLFQYTCDEPPLTCQWSDVAQRAAVAKQADPAFRTLVTTDMEQATAKSDGGKSVDIMVPLVNYMDDRPKSAYGNHDGGETRGQYDAFLKSGAQKELWIYESCMSHGCGGTVDIGNPSADQLYYTGWPTYMIDASATRARSLEWFSFRFGATGELYYETTMAYGSHDTWKDQWDFSGNGDGTLFYPGTPTLIGGQTDIPVASLRLKMIREGMEDYEYLKLLADAGDPAGARNIAQSLFGKAWQTDVKPGDLMGAREAIARKILAATGKNVPQAGVSVPPSMGGADAVAQFEYAIKASGCSSNGGVGGFASMLLVPLALFVARRRRA